MCLRIQHACLWLTEKPAQRLLAACLHSTAVTSAGCVDSAHSRHQLDGGAVRARPSREDLCSGWSDRSVLGLLCNTGVHPAADVQQGQAEAEAYAGGWMAGRHVASGDELHALADSWCAVTFPASSLTLAVIVVYSMALAASLCRQVTTQDPGWWC